jgi:poly(A) polymerase
LAAKLGFSIAKNTAAPIVELAPLFANISSARLFEEVIKWFHGGKSLETFHLLQKYKLLVFLFAQSVMSLQGKNSKIAAAMLHHGFVNTDKRVNEGKIIIPAFLYAVLLWWPLQEQMAVLRQDTKMGEVMVLQRAMQNVLQQQKNQTMIPQRLMFTIKDIWQLQYQLPQRKRRKIYYLLAHPKFRAAYDFLLLRARAGEEVGELADWWTRVQAVEEVERRKMIEHYA